MVYCPVVMAGRGSESGNVPRCGSPNPCLPQQQNTIPYAVKISVSRSWRWAKNLPEICWADLGDQ